MGKFKRIFTNMRVIILLCVVLFMLVSIRPTPWNEGVTIKNVVKNSTAALAGIANPKPTAPPLSKEIITSINNKPIANAHDYYAFVKNLIPNQTIQIKTTKSIYKLTTRERFVTIPLNRTQEVTVPATEEVNETVNGTVMLVNKTVMKKTLAEVTIKQSAGVEDIGLKIDDAPTTNLRKGLDLQGGTRVLLKPAEEVSEDTLNLMIDSLKERLNVYGLSDIVVNSVQDKPGFLGNPQRFILVEIAGATEEEVKELLAKQGKFEATIANQTVFRGGNDITYVCRTAECSGIDPRRGCSKVQGGVVCGFMFSISLSPEAAQNQADITKDISVVRETGGNYLSQPLKLFLDDQEVDSLNIADDLRGRAVTDIAITGSGFGANQDEAARATLENMRRLQTVLVTGSLPVKLDIVRIDTISPTLGAQFISNALLAALIAALAVLAVLAIVYRSILVALPIILTSALEVSLVLGLYALFGWNLDLAAIAGLIVSVGTGVNDQIVITGETLRGEGADSVNSWKDRIKKAFFIIFSGYLTEVVAMLPLLFAGAGLLKGFALTNILGVTLGVFITRPAYAAIVQILYEDKN